MSYRLSTMNDMTNEWTMKIFRMVWRIEQLCSTKHIKFKPQIMTGCTIELRPKTLFEHLNTLNSKKWGFHCVVSSWVALKNILPLFFFRKEFQDSSKLFEASLGFIEFFKAFLSNPVPIKSSFKRDCSKIFPVFKRIFADFKRDCSKFFQDSMGFYKILFQISILTNNR